MKKLLSILAMLFIITLVQAQDVVLYKTTAYCYKYELNDDYGNWVDTDCIITLNIPKDVISINNGYKDVFKLLSIVVTRSGVLAGDTYDETIFEVVNKNGINATLTIRYFVELQLYHFYIVYPKLMYVYEATRIEFY